MTRTHAIPKMEVPKPSGLFEKFMAVGKNLPGLAGHICNLKLKRRFCRRSGAAFDTVLAQTGAGDLCIDLGANIGTYTNLMAASGADVIGFEPDPDTFEVLKRNTATVQNITLYQKAVGAKAETLTLRRSPHWDPENPIKNSMGSSIVRDHAGMSDKNAVTFEVVDFPDFLRQLDRDVRILKMDIEGAEWDLLEALLDDPVLGRIDCLFVETHERVNPSVNIPRFNRLAARALALDRPYINLYWQ